MYYRYLGVILVLLVAVIGTMITNRGINSEEYEMLELSSYQPPSFVFGAVWTFLYASYAFVWWRYVEGVMGNALFALNMVLNFSWIVAFFGVSEYTETSLAVSRVIIIALLLLTIYQVYFIYKETNNWLPTILLGLYATWLTIATFLNFDTKLI